VPEASGFQVVHNGFRVHDPNTTRAAERGGELTRILTVGSLIPRKAHRYILEALAELKSRGKQLDYRFVGPVPPENLGAEYRACDLFVMPSWDEAFGVVYMEAMAYGKPVIACRGEGIAEIVEDGKNAVLVPPKDSEAVAEAINSLIENPDMARRIGDAGRQLASQFTWRRNAEQVLSIYREVTGGT